MPTFVLTFLGWGYSKPTMLTADFDDENRARAFAESRFADDGNLKSISICAQDGISSLTTRLDAWAAGHGRRWRNDHPKDFDDRLAVK